MQEYILTPAGRARRYRQKKKGIDPGPSPRSRQAAGRRQVAREFNLSVSQINRCLAALERHDQAQAASESDGATGQSP